MVPPGVRLDDGLTEDEAVAFALYNNPSLQSDLVQVGIARADLLEAASPANPLLQLLFPAAGLGWGVTLYWAFDWVWQLPFKVKAARREAQRTGETLVQRGLDLVRDVRLAHAEAVLAAERIRLRREAADLWGQSAAIVGAQARAGDLGEAEASSIVAEAANARDPVDRAQLDLRIATARLGLVIGQVNLEAPVSAAPLVEQKARLAPALVEVALRERPDLKAAALLVEASAARLGWERSRIVGLELMVNGASQPTIAAQPGVRVTPPILNFNLGGIGRGSARLRQAAWQLIAARQRAAVEVIEAQARLAQAWTSLGAFRERVLPAAEENARGAQLAEKLGAQSPLVVIDAYRRSVDAKLRVLELEADVRRAIAELDRSLGGGRP